MSASPTGRPSLVPSTSSSFAQASTSTSTTRNPLHLKVNRLLSTNLEDAATRQALDTLGADTFSSGAPLLRSSPNSSVAAGPGQLRKQVDQSMANGSRDFLDAFSEVNDKLSLLQSHLDQMHLCCNAVQAQLEQANTGTRYLLEHAEGLRVQRASTTVQQSLVHLFLSRFTLSPEELTALTSRDVPVGPALFSAMDKTARIHSDCRALLSGEAGDGTKAGEDLMEYASAHLEKGYDKIFKWCAFEARGFSKEALLEVSATMRNAIRRLKDRPELLNEVLTTLGTTRSSSILNLFLDALTRGGPSGLPRPIELHAHDPVRYVGDMLAWIHQTMAGEREFLESLFGIKDDGRWVGSIRGTRSGDDESSLRKLLDKDMEGCGRPLKIRVQQTIKSQEGSIMAYRIATLIHFYRVTMERTIGTDALMSTVLSEIMDHAYEAFFETLKAQGRSLLRFIQPPAAALSAPIQLRDALVTLREVMAVYSSSLLEDEASLLSRESDFQTVLDAALDPALQMCTKMGEMRPSEWDRSVFQVNCLETVLGALEGFAFTKTRMETLEDEEARYVERLTSEHYEHLLKESGLEGVLTAIDSHDGSKPLSEVPGLAPTALTSALNTFYTFLSTTDTLSSPRLSLLPPRITAAIHRAALDRITEAHAKVWEGVMDSKSGYEGKKSMLKRSKGEVATLLGLGE